MYVTHDATKLLKHRRANAIGVSLGQGYYGRPVLKLQLDVTYVNGTTETIVSDLSWKTDHGPTTFNRVATGGGFDPNDPTTGEIYDAQLEQPGWNAPAFDDAGWADAILRPVPAGVLQVMDVEPIRVTG